MARYDLEALLADLKSICTTSLNAKLTEITTEKADAVAMPEISGDAYFFQRIEKNRAAAFPAFVFYSVEDPTAADGLGPHTLEDYTITFIVVLKDTADGEKFSTRLLRYSRALKELFETASYGSKLRAKIRVSSVSPQSFGIDGLAGVFKGVGVQVKTVVG